jgi:hypothetical protein
LTTMYIGYKKHPRSSKKIWLMIKQWCMQRWKKFRLWWGIWNLSDLWNIKIDFSAYWK